MSSFKDLILETKAIIDGFSGGGGSSSNHLKIKRPTLTERMHKADAVIFVDQKDGVYIAKNRYGTHGKIPTPELTKLLSSILVHNIFDGKLKIFQEGLKQQIEESIKHTIATFHEKRR
jgi:hypothetical protein